MICIHLCNCCWEYPKFPNHDFFLKPSELPSETDAAQRPAGRFVHHYRFGPYRLAIVCEMPRCIDNRNKPNAASPHGKHTLSLITAVRAGCSREALFVFFFLFWAAWGGSGVEQFTQAGKAHKRGCTTSYSGEDWCGDYISYRRGAAMVTDCGMSLCGFPSTRAQIINNLHSVWHQPSLQGKASLSRQTTEQYFTRNDVVLGGRLRLSI